MICRRGSRKNDRPPPSPPAGRRKQRPRSHVPNRPLALTASGPGWEWSPGAARGRCRCREQERRQRLLEAARIRRRYARCTLAKYHPAPGQGTQPRAFDDASKLVDEYPAVERGLLFTGPVGTGKTHLSAALIRGLTERGVPCPFYELGASKPTGWVRDTMMQVIGTRYNGRKRTIFTTNYPDARRRPAEQTLEGRVGVRPRSRLYEMCRTVAVAGGGYRRRLAAQL